MKQVYFIQDKGTLTRDLAAYTAALMGVQPYYSTDLLIEQGMKNSLLCTPNTPEEERVGLEKHGYTLRSVRMNSRLEEVLAPLRTNKRQHKG